MRWIGAVSGLVVLAVLIGAVRFVMLGGDGPLAGRPGGTPLNGSASAFDAGEQRIVGLLPPGYTADSCARATHPFPNAVASLDCSQNSGSPNPTDARFTLYDDLDTLRDDFLQTADEMVLTACPGGNPWGPGTWTLGSNAGQIGGQIACGTVDDRPDIAWTRDAQLLLATVNGGADLGSLYQWWQRYGTVTRQ
jgi:serine/threonine-protein kinase